LLAAVLRAPMAFFDGTPLGRVTNRFSKVRPPPPLSLYTFHHRFFVK